jgi:hypothetical protein
VVSPDLHKTEIKSTDFIETFASLKLQKVSFVFLVIIVVCECKT